MRKILIAAPLLLLACGPQMAVPPDPPPVDPSQQHCVASGQQGLIGQPARVLQTMKFAVETRIIRPGDMVTADYRFNRLNIEIDEKERISRVFCG